MSEYKAVKRVASALPGTPKNERGLLKIESPRSRRIVENRGPLVTKG